jgi:hypothetical protein
MNEIPKDNTYLLTRNEKILPSTKHISLADFLQGRPAKQKATLNTIVDAESIASGIICSLYGDN